MFIYQLLPNEKDGQPHVFTLPETAGDTETWRECQRWCREQFGQRPSLVHGSRWWSMPGKVYFAREDDAFAFRIRWC